MGHVLGQMKLSTVVSLEKVVVNQGLFATTRGRPSTGTSFLGLVLVGGGFGAEFEFELEFELTLAFALALALAEFVFVFFGET